MGWSGRAAAAGSGSGSEVPVAREASPGRSAKPVTAAALSNPAHSRNRRLFTGSSSSIESQANTMGSASERRNRRGSKSINLITPLRKRKSRQHTMGPMHEIGKFKVFGDPVLVWLGAGPLFPSDGMVAPPLSFAIANDRVGVERRQKSNTSYRKEVQAKGGVVPIRVFGYLDDATALEGLQCNGNPGQDK